MIASTMLRYFSYALVRLVKVVQRASRAQPSADVKSALNHIAFLARLGLVPATMVLASALFAQSAPPDVGFASAASRVDETAGVHHVTLNISPAPSTDIGVFVRALRMSTATRRKDFAPLPRPYVTVPANSTSVEIPISIINDNKVEGNETIVLGFASSPDYLPTAHYRHTLTIVDDDKPPHSKVSFAGSGSEIDEDTRSGHVSVNLSPPPAEAFDLRYQVSGTATPGTDAIGLEVILDHTDSAQKPTQRDAPGLIFTPSALQLAEGGERSYTVKLTKAPSDGTTSITVSPRAAEDGDVDTEVTIDTDPNTAGHQSTLVFNEANWQDGLPVVVSAREDKDKQNDLVTIAHSASGGGYDPSDIRDLALVIIDNDTPGLVFEPRAVTMSKDESDATYTLRLAMPPAGAVRVNVKPQVAGQADDAPAQAGVTLDTDPDQPGQQSKLTFNTENWNRPRTITVSRSDGAEQEHAAVTLLHKVSGEGYRPNDYSPLTGLVRVPADSSEVKIPIVVTDDSADEDPETLVLRLVTSAGYTLGSRDMHTLTINDNDHSVPAMCVPESLRLDVEGYAREAHLGSAHVYQWQRVLAAFGSGNGAVPTGVSEARDFVERGRDRWVPVLTALRCLQGAQFEPHISVKAVEARVTEGGQVAFEVTASPAPAADLEVKLTIAEDESSDYLASEDEGARTVVIQAGQESTTFRLKTVDDRTNEASGRVSAQVVIASGYRLGTSPKAMVMVSDNDEPLPSAPRVGFASATSNVDEAAGTHRVTISLSPAPTVDLDIALDTKPTSTATKWADFSPLPHPHVTVPAGRASFDLAVTIIDDDKVEDDETLVLVIAPSSGYQLGDAGHEVHTLSILDNDQAEDNSSITVMVSPRTLEFNESDLGRTGTKDHAATYMVSLNGEPADDVAVNITVPDGAPFTVSDTRLNFTPSNWQDAQAVSVTALNDEIDNAGDARSASITHTIELKNSDNANASSTDTMVTVMVTVIDDDDHRPSPLPGNSVYISPRGDDASGLGSKDSPWATLPKVRNSIAAHIGALPDNEMTADIVVYLRAGTYRLGETFVLDADDSGNNGFKILYRNYPGEEAIVSGGRRLEGWKVSETTDRNGGQLLEAAITDNDRFRQLYVGREAGVRAREPNLGTTLKTPPRSMHVSTTEPRRVVSLEVPRDADGDGLTDLAFTILRDLPADEISRVEHWRLTKFNSVLLLIQSFTVGESNGFAYVRGEHAPFEAANIARIGGRSANMPFYWENALAFVDEPGEWFLDESNNKVYYKPDTGEVENGTLTTEVTIPVVQTLLHLDGARNVWFHGLRFQHSNYTRPTTRGYVQRMGALVWKLEDMHKPVSTMDPKQATVRLAHAWRATPGAIEIEHSANIHFERNAFRHFGGNGMVLNEGAKYIGIEGNVFSETFDTHLVIHGGLDPTPTDAEHLQGISISNNLMEKPGATDKHGLHIFAGYPDRAYIEHNHMVDANMGGINLGWHKWKSGQMPPFRNNSIRYNRLEDILKRVVDWGFIHVKSATDEGVVHTDISRNWGHRITQRVPSGAVVGWYLDDQTWHARAVENVTTDIATAARFNTMYLQYPYLGPARFNTVNRNFDEDTKLEWSYPNGAYNSKTTRTYDKAEQPTIDLVKLNAGLESDFKNLAHFTRQGALGGAAVPGGGTAGLLSRWPMDNSQEDTTPARRALSLAGGADYSADATQGAFALRINAPGDYATATQHEGVLGSHSRSFTAWVKTLDTDAVIVSWGSDVTGGKWVIRTRSGTGAPGALSVDINGGHVVGSTVVADGQWHHIAVVFEEDGTPDVGDVRLYVDGRLEDVSAEQGGVVATAPGQDVRFGNTSTLGLGAELSQGLIDEARLYDRALLASEVAHLAIKPVAANWSFERSPVDSSGNGHTLTLRNGAGFSSDGAVGEASLSLDGVDDHAIAEGFAGITGTGPRTISAWIKTTDTAGTIVAWGADQTGKAFRVQVHPQSAAGLLRFDGGGTQITGTTNLADGAWHHIAVVWASDGTPQGAELAQLFVDGYPEAISSSSDRPMDTSGSGRVHIGVSPWALTDTDHLFAGEVDNLRIFREALSPVDVNRGLWASPLPRVSVAGGKDILTEGDHVVFTVTASPPPTADLTVNLHIGNDRAGNSFVHTGHRGHKTVTIKANQSSATYRVQTVKDRTAEINGTVSALVLGSAKYTIGRSLAKVSVNDDDQASSSIELKGGSGIIEGGEAEFILTATPAPRQDILVRFHIDDAGTSDFLAFSEQGIRSVPIAKGKTSTTFKVPTVNDGLMEPFGHISARLVHGLRYEIGTDREVLVAVADDDTRIVKIEGGTGITEGDDAVFAITATPTPSTDIEVMLNIVDAANADFLAPHEEGRRTLRIPAGSGSVAYPVRTVSDAVMEGSGELSATLLGGADYVVDAPSVATVAVNDDDTEITTISILGGEAIIEGGDAVFTLKASPAIDLPIDVRLDIADDSASDFLARIDTGLKTVRIAAKTSSVTFRVPTVEDDLDEANGTVSATLVAGPGYEIGSPSAADVAVSDNDEAVIAEFAQESSTAIESTGTHKVSVEFSRPVPSATLEFSIAGTAAEGSDYGNLPSSLTVPTNATSIEIPINMIDDDANEVEETVILTLISGDGYTPGTVNTHTLTIRDNDPAVFYLSPRGDDVSGTGTRSNPWASLAKAQSEVAKRLAALPEGLMNEDMVVQLRTGTYPLTETLEFDADDSGNNGYKVLYRNYPGEEPVISGGKRLTGWSASGDGSGNYEAAVEAGDDFSMLLVGNAAAVRAREPDFGSFRTSRAANFESDDSRLRSISVPEDADSDDTIDPEFTALLGMEDDQVSQVEYFQLLDYRAMQLPIDTFARHKTSTGLGVATIKGEHAQKDAKLGLGASCASGGCPYYWENALAFLDTAGEWFLDKANNKIHYRPKRGEVRGARLTPAVTVPVIDTLLRLENARNIWFHGIRFEHTSHATPSSRGYVQSVPGLPIKHEDASTPVSTDVPGANTLGTAGAWAPTPGAIEIKDSANIHFERNAFRHFGGNGMVLGEGTKHIGIEGNVFAETSDTHIVVHGGMDPSPSEAEQVKGISITSNLMERSGAADKLGLSVFAGYPERAHLEHNQVLDAGGGAFSIGWGQWMQGQMPGLANNSIRHNKFVRVLGRINDWGVVHLRSATDVGVRHTDVSRNWATDLTDAHPHDRVAGWYLGARTNHARVIENITSNVTSDGFDPIYLQKPARGAAENNTVDSNFDEDSKTKWWFPDGNQSSQTYQPYDHVDQKTVDLVKVNAGLKPAYKDLTRRKHRSAVGGRAMPGGGVAGMLSRWPMDLDTEDVMPGGHDLTLHAGADYSADAIQGSFSLRIEEESDHAIAAHNLGVLGTGSRTFAAWVKTIDTDAVIVSWGSDISGGKWVVRTSTETGVAGALSIDVNGGFATGETVVADGEWHHIAVVFEEDSSPDVADVRLYVDGQREAYSNRRAASIDTASGQDVRFGTSSRLGWGAEMSSGLIDDARIYDRALLGSEVAHLATKRLAASWLFDNDATDSSGNGHHLAFHGGAMYSAQGIRGSASLKLDGTDDYAVASTFAGITGTKPRSISAWIRTTDTRGTIVAWGTPAWAGGLMKLYVAPGSDGGVLGLTDAARDTKGATNIADGEWHHVAVTWSHDGVGRASDFAQLFVDGYPDSTPVESRWYLDTSDAGTVHIGTISWNPTNENQLLHGEIDNLRIFSEALTPVEINEMSRR